MSKKNKVATRFDNEIIIEVPTRGEFTIRDCIVCGLPFGIPSSYYELGVKNLAEPFHCPRGHSMINIKANNNKKEKARVQKKKEKKEKEKKEKKEESAKKKITAEKEKNRGLLGRILFFKVF